MSKLSARMSWGMVINALACMILMMVAIYYEDYFFAAIFWILWGILIAIREAVDVIGARLDEL